MKGREINKLFTLNFVILTILLLVFLPIQIIKAADQITISFDPQPSEPPYAPINPDPPDGALNVGLPVTLCVEVYDITNDPIDVYFYDAFDDSLIDVDYNVPSDWSVASVVWNGLLNGQAYSWYAIARAHGYENRSETWIFYTRQSSSPPSPPGPSPQPPNQLPIANITGPIIGYVNETLVFHAYNSYDSDGNISGYRWDFNNDGEFDTEWLDDVLITHNYNNSGNYTIVLEVVDNDGASATASHNIQIIVLEYPLQLPIPKINGPFYAYTNEILEFSSNGSFDPDGIIVNYTWYFGDGNISYIENPNHSYAQSGNYTIIVKITDNDKLNNITSTKAFIIDREKPKKEKEDRNLPLILLLILIMAIIATIIILIIKSKTYRFTLLIEKLDESKKKHTKNVELVVENKSSNKEIKETSNKSSYKFEENKNKKIEDNVEIEFDEIINKEVEPEINKNTPQQKRSDEENDISSRIDKLLSEMKNKKE